MRTAECEPAATAVSELRGADTRHTREGLRLRIHRGIILAEATIDGAANPANLHHGQGNSDQLKHRWVKLGTAAISYKEGASRGLHAGTTLLDEKS